MCYRTITEHFWQIDIRLHTCMYSMTIWLHLSQNRNDVHLMCCIGVSLASDLY